LEKELALKKNALRVRTRARPVQQCADARLAPRRADHAHFFNLELFRSRGIRLFN